LAPPQPRKGRFQISDSSSASSTHTLQDGALSLVGGAAHAQADAAGAGDAAAAAAAAALGGGGWLGGGLVGGVAAAPYGSGTDSSYAPTKSCFGCSTSASLANLHAALASGGGGGVPHGLLSAATLQLQVRARRAPLRALAGLI
jgi:hypothetical protein